MKTTRLKFCGTNGALHTKLYVAAVACHIGSVRAGMAIGRRAQNARNIRAKRVNYRTLINAIARSQYLTV